MGDATVQVESLWTIGGQAQRQMREMHREAGSLSGAMDGLKAQMLGIGTAAAAALGVYGVGGFLKGIVGANQELEEARFSMAGLMYQAQKMGAVNAGFRDFADAQALAATTYREMEIHAAKAIGTATDYQRAWQAVSLPIMKAGGDLNTVMEVSKLLVPTAQMYGQQLDTAAFSIKQALMGMVDGRDMMIQMLGIGSAEINNLARKDPSAALERILTAMRRNTEMMGAAGDLFSAKSATLEDAWLRLKREIGAPLFNELKTQMDAFATWIGVHQKEISAWAKEWGMTIKDAFLEISRVAKWISDHWTGIKNVILFIVGYNVLGRLTRGMAQMAASAITYADAMVAAKLAAASTSGPGGVSAAGGAAGSLAGAGSLAAIAGVAQKVFMVGMATEAAYMIGKQFADTVEDANKRTRETQQRFWDMKAGGLAGANEIVNERMRRERLDMARKSGLGVAGYDPNWEPNRNQRLAYLEKNADSIYKEMVERDKATEAMRSFVEAMQLGTQSANWVQRAVFAFGGAQASAVEAVGDTRKKFWDAIKGLKPTQDFRGSRIEIKVDARHADPDRVTSMIVRHLGRLAERPTQSRNAPWTA